MRGLGADGFRAMQRGFVGTLLCWVAQAVLTDASSLMPDGRAVSAPLVAGQALAQCGQVLSVIVVINGISLVSQASAEFNRAKRCYIVRLIANALALILNAALTLLLSRAADATWLGGANTALVMLTACVELGGVLMAEWLGARRLLSAIDQVGRECGVAEARLGAINETRRMYGACCVLAFICVAPLVALVGVSHWVDWWIGNFRFVNTAWLMAALLMGAALLMVDLIAQIRLIDHCRRAYRVVRELSK